MSASGWSIVESAGLRIGRCELLDVPGVAHAFSTREIDLGGADFEAPALVDRGRALCTAAGLRGKNPRVLKQVHGDRILTVDDSRPGDSADGLLQDRGSASAVVPAVRTADCVPVLLVEESGKAVAAVHAGWRGTAAQIVLRAVDGLEALGHPPARLRVALGPAIGSCCYQVGPEVVREVARASGVADNDVAQERPGGPHLNLRQANRFQLESVGVPPQAISVAPWCTACDGELFFSHRREGPRAGRMMALIGWITSP